VCTGVSWEDLRKEDHLEDPDVDGSVILQWTFKKWQVDINWIDLAEHTESGGRL